MNLIRLLRSLNEKRLDLEQGLEEADCKGGEAYDKHSVEYEKVLGVMQRVYEKAKRDFPDHPIIQELDEEDITETFSLGAIPYDGGM